MKWCSLRICATMAESFSDDVRFSNKSNQLLIGRNAREYKPAIDSKKNDKKKEVKQQASHHVASVKARSKKSLSV